MKTRVTDQLFDKLRSKVIEGELKPGTRLSVPGIALQEDVSRSPVREAISRLVSEGLATEEPHRGATVRRIDPDDIVSLYEVRELLEGLVARLAVERRGQAFVVRIANLVESHAEAIRANDHEKRVLLDLAFHAEIRHASGNQEAIQILERIQSQVRLAMHTTVVTAGAENALADHREILAAIRAGDSVRAEAASRKHIARLTTALRTNPESWV